MSLRVFVLALPPRGAREVGKDQFGLFGPMMQSLRGAQPHVYGGGTPGAGLQTVVRTDSLGRSQHRHVRADQGAAPAAPAAKPAQRPKPADGPAQFDLFGAPQRIRATPTRQRLAPKAAVHNDKLCRRCTGAIPKHDEHAKNGTCGACARTVDWTAQAQHHTMTSSLFG